MTVDVNSVLHCVVSERIFNDICTVFKETLQKSVSYFSVFVEINKFFDLFKNLKIFYFSYYTDPIRICAHFCQIIYYKVIHKFSFFLFKAADDLLNNVSSVRITRKPQNVFLHALSKSIYLFWHSYYFYHRLNAVGA